jgi:hypothetical protein
MDRHFRLQNKKILLLIDNAPSHFDPNYHLPDDDEIEELESTGNTDGNHSGTSRNGF